MNKAKKIIISIILAITALLTFTTNSDAYHVGQKKFITYQDYIHSSNMYCLEHHDSLRSSGMTYKIVRKVTLKGRIAKADNKNSEVDSIYNARLAYIVGAKNHSKNSRKNAVWNFMGTWMKNVGNKFGIKYLHNFVRGSGTHLDKEAEEYSKRFKNSGDLGKIADKTDKNKVKGKIDGNRMIIGPFKWEFSGELNKITVKDKNNKNIDSVKVGQYKNKDFKEVKIKDIKSNKNFYLYIPFTTEASKISVSATVEIDVKAATLWFLRAGASSWQNMMIAEPSTKQQKITTDFTYKPDLYGSLDIIKVNKENHTIKLKDVEFYLKAAEGKYVRAKKDGNKYETTGYVDKDKATKFKTDKNGEFLVEKLIIGKYEVFELSNPNFGYDPAVISDKKPFATIKVTNNSKKLLENKQIFGTLDVIKVNADNKEFKLPNVKFLLKSPTGEYVKASKNGSKYTAEPTYVNQANATVFETDKDGKILVEKLLMGEYGLCEIENPNYGYDQAVISKDKPMATVTVKPGKDIYENIVGNKQVYVKLSGYVWKDIVKDVKGKEEINKTAKDSLYTNPSDELIEGITVRLMDRTTGKAVKTATTDKNGSYLFTDVLVEKIVKGEYYIEFEYDGITYTNVTPLVDKNIKTPNNSKAAEDANKREEFNNKFATIEGKGYTQPDKGVAIGTNGTRTDLEYTIKKDNKADDGSNYTTATFNHSKEKYPIQANTDVANYHLKDVFTYGMEEIKNNNLGLWEREQPYIQMRKELQNVKVTINGFENTYNYSSRYKNAGQSSSDGFNVGVKFGSKYGGSKAYSRAIYKEDYQYKNPSDPTKELKVYATYCISMQNLSGLDSLVARVNSIADYYDNKYEIYKIGRGLDERGNVTSDIEYVNSDPVGKYKKVIIKNNDSIGAKETKSVYVQLQLKPENVIQIMDSLYSNPQAEIEREFANIVEVNSYSILQNNKPYAGIDKNSNPGNTEPGNRESYEDDTDIAPALRLETQNSRKITGAVFEDDTGTLEIRTGQERKGNGIYDENKERPVVGAKVILTEESGRTYEVTTNDAGYFEIGGVDGQDIIPGKYTLTYTWGNGTYIKGDNGEQIPVTVQKYKSTIYSENRGINWDTYTDWYKKDVETRYSDAIDNWDIRTDIDSKTNQITKNTDTTQGEMVSTAPPMAIGVEYEGTPINGDVTQQQYAYTDSNEHKFVHIIKNLDFGIARRPMQQLEIKKRVKHVKATLANGQVIVDSDIDEKGNFTGEHKHITYSGPTGTDKGNVKLELDNELIQGCRLEVEYEIVATNESEIDYDSKEYYYYGTKTGNVTTLTPKTIIDYLDEEWAFEENETWKIKLKEDNEIKNLVEENVLNSITGRKILLTKVTDKLKPTESKRISLKTSKVLSTTDDVNLNNDVELVEIEKSWGATPEQKPGNYKVGEIDASDSNYRIDSAQAEEVIVIPATGENRNYIIPIAVGLIALIVLGTGVVLIKRKTLTEE